MNRHPKMPRRRSSQMSGSAMLCSLLGLFEDIRGEASASKAPRSQAFGAALELQAVVSLGANY